MGRIVVLDAGPLGPASKPSGRHEADACLAWLRALDAAGVLVVVPEIADFEVRRELLRVGASAGLARLDRLAAALEHAPLTSPAVRRAAELCAGIRRVGLPTADPHSLDADCLLAAQTSLLAGPDGSPVVIATTNVGHLGRFPGVDARPWEAVGA